MTRAASGAATESSWCPRSRWGARSRWSERPGRRLRRGADSARPRARRSPGSPAARNLSTRVGPAGRRTAASPDARLTRSRRAVAASGYQTSRQPQRPAGHRDPGHLDPALADRGGLPELDPDERSRPQQPLTRIEDARRRLAAVLYGDRLRGAADVSVDHSRGAASRTARRHIAETPETEDRPTPGPDGHRGDPHRLRNSRPAAACNASVLLLAADQHHGSHRPDRSPTTHRHHAVTTSPAPAEVPPAEPPVRRGGRARHPRQQSVSERAAKRRANEREARGSADGR